MKFIFVGDLMLGGEFVTHAKAGGFSLLRPFELVRSHIAGADILFLNLEGPIFEGPKKRAGATSILSNHPSVLELLRGCGAYVLNLANNHIMDYGLEGLEHTLALLSNKGIHYVGAGKSCDEAGRTLIVEVKGKRVAFLAFSSDEPHVGAVIAGPEEAGCASYLELDQVVHKVRNLKQYVDIICVSIHWGHEYFSYPSPEQRTIAHSLVDAGATYVIGHHPHVIQGIESYNESLIIYSLGNFFMPPIRLVSGRLQPSKPMSKEFMLIESEVDGPGSLSFQVSGGSMDNDYTLNFFDSDQKKQFDSRIRGLSEPLYSKDYDDFWVGYRVRGEKELARETLLEALQKIFTMSFAELIKTVKFSDIKRNSNRLFRLLFRSG